MSSLADLLFGQVYSTTGKLVYLVSRLTAGYDRFSY